MQSDSAINFIVSGMKYHITWFKSHFFFKKFLFIYFWLRWIFVAARGLSLLVARGGYSSMRCTGFSWQWLLLLQSTGSRCTGSSSCGTRAQQLWGTGLVAPWHVGSSRARAQTRVPCIGRQILNHCPTREVPKSHFLNSLFCELLVHIFWPYFSWAISLYSFFFLIEVYLIYVSFYSEQFIGDLYI